MRPHVSSMCATEHKTLGALPGFCVWQHASYTYFRIYSYMGLFSKVLSIGHTQNPRLASFFCYVKTLDTTGKSGLDSVTSSYSKRYRFTVETTLYSQCYQTVPLRVEFSFAESSTVFAGYSCGLKATLHLKSCGLKIIRIREDGIDNKKSQYTLRWQ